MFRELKESVAERAFTFTELSLTPDMSYTSTLHISLPDEIVMFDIILAGNGVMES